MAIPSIDYLQELLDTISNASALPPESFSPWEHYKRSSLDCLNLINYMKRNVSRVNYYPKAFDRHMGRLHGMALANLVGAFERFLKELAVTCVNELSDFSLDGRLDIFSLSGSVAGAHFSARSLGNALCEADTWLNCKGVNNRFRKLLADPFDDGSFWLFPQQGQQPKSEQYRYQLISAIFQLRHTIVHNLGVITESDATKFRHLLRSSVDAHKVLVPTSKNFRQIKGFLDQTAEMVNRRIAVRLAELLTTLHQDNYLSLDPALKAPELASLFGIPVTICGHSGFPQID